MTVCLLLGTTGMRGATPAEVRLVVDKPAERLYVITADGDTVKTFDVALGKNLGQKEHDGDCRTPEGEFFIVAISPSGNWGTKVGGMSSYGPWFLRLGGTKWHGIGIHGTNKPQSIGTRASLGCIRMHNEDIVKLKDMVRKGTRVTILPDTVTTVVTDTLQPFRPSLSIPLRRVPVK